jgi:spore coat protein U-like protein
MAMSAILVSTASLNLPAYASITAANMNVSANITANCSLSNTDLNFGDYDATGINRSRDLLATATISTTCTSGATGVVTMGQGEHVFYCISNNCIRRMANSEETSHLTYQIYTDAGYSVVWNHNTGDMRSVANVTGSGASQGMTVYGKIPKNQINATAGSYSDTIIITLTY